MSNRLLGLAWQMPAGLGSTARLLYVWFCDRAIEDDGDTTWATVADMCAATEANDRNTRIALAKLRAHQLVTPLTSMHRPGRIKYRVNATPVENNRSNNQLRSKTTGVTAANSGRKQPDTPVENNRSVPIVPQLVPKRENARTNGAAPPAIASPALSHKALYETFVRVLGRPPQAGRERGKWLYGIQHLHTDGIAPPEVPRLVSAYRDKYGPDIACHPGTIHDHLPELRGANHAITQRTADADTRAAAQEAADLERLRLFAEAGIALPASAYAKLTAAGIAFSPPGTAR